jgi:hypothetical protein
MATLIGFAPAAAQESKPTYEDGKYDFSVKVDPSWKKADLGGYGVPGVLREAFAGPGTSSIVLFVQEPGQAYDPRFLVDASAQGIQQTLKADVKEKDVKTVAGKKAMWLIVEGPGTGGAIDGKGDVKTVQHWVAIPREKDIVIALLTCPSADFASCSKVFGESVKSLVVGGKQTQSQIDSK